MLYTPGKTAALQKACTLQNATAAVVAVVVQ
jgi:hypothetical protein